MHSMSPKEIRKSNPGELNFNQMDTIGEIVGDHISEENDHSDSGSLNTPTNEHNTSKA